MSRKSLKLLSFKIAGHKLVNRVQYLIAQILRMIPGTSMITRIKFRRIPSIKFWIQQQRLKLSWRARVSGPNYTVLFPELSMTPIKPKRLFSDDVILAPANMGLGQFYNYWDIRSGFDARKGIYHKFIQYYDEVFLAWIPNGIVVGPNGAVLTPDRKLIEESIWAWREWLINDRTQKSIRLPAAIRINEPCYVVSSNYAESYAHWILETLPRLYGLITIASEIRPTLIFGQELKPWQIDTLNWLGFGDYKRLSLNNNILQIENLFLPGHVGVPGTPHPQACQWVRETILKNVKLPTDSVRIYITRRYASRRRVLNETELEPILKEYGFEIIASEQLTFKEEVKLFSRAEALISLHGGGMVNLMFVKKGCKVFEIHERTHVSDQFYNLSSILELDYYYDICEPIYDNIEEPHTQGYADVRIDSVKFKEQLRFLFG